eukprot:CAMPEP_0114984214 /NCGR_PEP_ID=MMETSP0216-20121206/7148_1 /TAXON_ID=223996 /ORGANISM="Protocruzia adherens, Strain Boccale" /LENGTH=538 /DNA_ID=CAMNT_0002346317 /DNA_START=40 /DNA_END=1656 /DNA_ORIENTATION=-
MEFERGLFRIHERVLKMRCLKSFLRTVLTGMIVIIVFLATCLFYLHGTFSQESSCLRESIREWVLDDRIGSVNKNFTIGFDKNAHQFDSLPLEEAERRVDLTDSLSKEDVYRIALVPGKASVGIDLEKVHKYVDMKFALDKYSLLLDEEVREKYEFQTHDVAVSIDCFSPSPFVQFFFFWQINLETIMINQIIDTFQFYNGTVHNIETNEYWSWKNTTYSSYYPELKESDDSSTVAKIFDWLLVRIGRLLRAFVSLFFISGMTALLIRIAISCSAVMIYLCASWGIARQDANRARLIRWLLARSFPWLGFQTEMLRRGERSNKRLFCSYLSLLFIFYFLFGCLYFLWDYLVFGKSIPEGLSDSLYSTIGWIEFYILAFVRARTTIRFFARYCSIVIALFMIYVFSTFYGFYYAAMYLLEATIVLFCAFFLYFYEIPALEGNPFSIYTPSIGNPRTGYMPVFSPTWHHGLPDIWSVFYPVQSQEHFSDSELGYINRSIEDPEIDILETYAPRDNPRRRIVNEQVEEEMQNIPNADNGEP